MTDYVYIDKTLYGLAYEYLMMKKKTIRKDYTYADLLCTCSEIMNKVAYINKNSPKKVIEFKEEGIFIRQDWLSNWKKKIKK